VVSFVRAITFAVKIDQTHNIARFDSGPMVHRGVLFESFDENLPDQLHPGVQTPGPDVGKHRRLLQSRLDGCAGPIRSGGNTDLRAECRFVRREAVQSSLRVDDEDAVVHVETDQELVVSCRDTCCHNT